MKNTYIFSITSKNGVNNLVIIDDKSRENAIQKAKIETLAPLKPFNTNDEIIEIFHEMEYSFSGTVRVFGKSYNTKIL